MAVKKAAGVIFAVVLSIALSTAAFARTLVPGGNALGIRMTTDGVVIAGVAELESGGKTCSPASDAGLKAGDIIKKLGSRDVSTAQDLKAALEELDGSKTSVTIERAGKTKQLNITPAQTADGGWKLGLLLRDGISGIGTLTFYDPETGVYGALGHSISDESTGSALPLGEGDIYKAQIVGIVPGKAGEPGQLDGETDFTGIIGDIRKNCGCGIFGVARLDGETLETGEMKVGRASILCTVSGEGVREYSVEITKLMHGSEYGGAVLTVTDPELLELTGGIVQGMSGSPIIQNGRLVGAVTHVLVNDPTTGYGISIENMLDAAA